jgi:type II secretory pathway component PulJ
MFLSKLRNTAGISLVEILVSLIITGLLATASFQFYSDMNGRTLTQQDLSDLQHICRTTVYELKKSIRMAGYKIGSHDPFEIAGDTLFVYQQGTNPVDTIRYYLVQEYRMDAAEGAHQLYQLMKQMNSESAVPMSDHLRSLVFTEIDSANIQVEVTAESERRDHEYTANDGFKSFTLTELIKIRNVN